jgi:hypothetical protein
VSQSGAPLGVVLVVLYNLGVVLFTEAPDVSCKLDPLSNTDFSSSLCNSDCGIDGFMAVCQFVLAAVADAVSRRALSSIPLWLPGRWLAVVASRDRRSFLLLFGRRRRL